VGIMSGLWQALPAKMSLIRIAEL